MCVIAVPERITIDVMIGECPRLFEMGETLQSIGSNRGQ